MTNLHKNALRIDYDTYYSQHKSSQCASLKRLKSLYFISILCSTQINEFIYKYIKKIQKVMKKQIEIHIKSEKHL